ncbi:MAG: hypothetical protein AB8E15_05910 [Bdellovibrionales bacterium]
MKKFKKVLAFAIVSTICSLSTAGKEAGDNEIAIQDRNGGYHLASVYLDRFPGEELVLKENIKRIINNLLNQTDRVLLGKGQSPAESTKKYLSDSLEFKDSMFSSLREYLLVEPDFLAKNCKKIIIVPGFEETAKHLACNSGDFVYINKEVFPELSILSFALLIVHEGIHDLLGHAYNELQVADLLKAINIVETKLLSSDLSASDLTDNDRAVLQRFPKRVAQIFRNKGFTSITVDVNGVVLTEGSSYIFRDDVNSSKSYISSGTRVEGQVVLQNSYIKNSIIRVSNSSNTPTVLKEMKVSDSDVIFNTSSIFPSWIAKEDSPYIYDLLFSRELLFASIVYVHDRVLNTEYHGEFMDGKKVLNSFKKGLDSEIPFNNSTISDSQIEVFRSNRSKISSCRNIVLFADNGACINSSNSLVLISGNSKVIGVNGNTDNPSMDEVFAINGSVAKNLQLGSVEVVYSNRLDRLKRAGRFETVAVSDRLTRNVVILNETNASEAAISGFTVFENSVLSNDAKIDGVMYMLNTTIDDSNFSLLDRGISSGIFEKSRLQSSYENWELTNGSKIDFEQNSQVNSDFSNVSLNGVEFDRGLVEYFNSNGFKIEFNKMNVTGQNISRFRPTPQFNFTGNVRLENFDLAAKHSGYFQLEINGDFNGQSSRYCVGESPSIELNSENDWNKFSCEE